MFQTLDLLKLVPQYTMHFKYLSILSLFWTFNKSYESKYGNHEDVRVPLSGKSKKTTARVHSLLSTYNLHSLIQDKKLISVIFPSYPSSCTIEIEAIFLTNFLLNK